MAIIVRTDQSRSLLVAIKDAIRQGKIETWSIDSDGDFTHSPDQWKNKAWFRPRFAEDMLVFNILGNKSGKMSRVVYGIYHGRFVEMLLVHFDLQFREATATALPENPDIVS